jgi:rod shape determining protein RodA
LKNLIHNTDWKLLFLYLLLISFGILNVFSVSNELGQKQLVWALVSMGFFFVISISNLLALELYSIVFYFLGIVLLIGLFVVGKEINGAKAWYSFGGFSFQPAELVKFFVAIQLANYAHSKFEFNLSLKNLFFSSIIIGIPVLLILLQPDFGSVIIFSSFLIPLYREGLSGYIFGFIIFFILLFVCSLIYPSLEVISLLFLVLSFICFYLFNSLTSREKDNFYNYFMGYSQSSTLSFIGLLIYSIFSKSQNNIILPLVGLLSTSLISYRIYSFKKQSDNANSSAIPQIILVCIMLQIALFGVSFFSNSIFNEVLKPHQKERLLVLIEGESKYRDTSGYNLLYAKTAIGSGEFLGKGFKNGTITSGEFVPEQQTDYIFTTVGEEWGFVGSVFLIVVYCLFISRIFMLAENQRSKFARFYGYSIASIFLYHFMLNISMVMGLFPTVGVPLPFFSYGGSSFLAFSIMFFVFLKLNYQNITAY